MNTASENVTVTIPQYLIDDMRRETGSKTQNISQLVEEFVYAALHTPNKLTLAAIEEAKSGIEMEDFTPDELDQYIYEATEKVHTV